MIRRMSLYSQIRTSVFGHRHRLYLPSEDGYLFANSMFSMWPFNSCRMGENIWFHFSRAPAFSCNFFSMTLLQRSSFQMIECSKEFRPKSPTSVHRGGNSKMRSDFQHPWMLPYFLARTQSHSVPDYRNRIKLISDQEQMTWNCKKYSLHLILHDALWTNTFKFAHV